jgi:molecular chaperone GrpE
VPDTGVSTSASAEEASRPAPAVDRSEQFLQATRLAEARISEVAGATAMIKAENDAYRDRLEGQLSEKFEQQRERLLMASMQTLEALDRAIEIARQSDAAEALVSGVMLVRTQLFRILQEEGLERISVLGLPFDPRSSELVRHKPVTDSDHDGLVVEELQGGHQLRGHTIRRAKVVVGQYVEEAAAVVTPAPDPALAEPVKAEEVAQPAAAPEEPAVLENWAEPTHPATPSSVLLAGVVLPPSASPPPPVATARVDEVDGADAGDDRNETMVLGDGQADLVRPPPPLPTSMPTPPLRATAGAAAAAAVAPAIPPRPPTTPPRLRTGPVPPRDRTPVYERRPPKVVAPAPTSAPTPPATVPPAAVRTKPGVRTLPPPAPAGRGRGFYAALAAGIAVLLGALVVELWFLSHRAKTEPAIASASPSASSGAGPAVSASPPTIPEEVTVVTTPAAPSDTPNGMRPAATPGAAPAKSIPPGPGTLATPGRSAAASAPAPSHATTAPPAAPVNPVPALLGQGEQASAARRFDEAIARYNDVLKIEPQNAEALAGKLHAAGDRASMGRYFLTAVTMSEGKSSGGGIKGFDGGQVVKSQCECALMYEVAPANPVQDQPYAVSVFLRNDSKKDIKPQNISASVTVNGSAASHPITLAAKDVARGQRVMVGRLQDTWKVGTTSWSMEAAVGASGNTYRAQLTWELRVPTGQ